MLDTMWHFMEMGGLKANYDRAQINAAVEEARGNYEQFLGWAVDGEYLESENPTTNLLNGCITFHKYMTPFGPAEDIEELVEFDPDALSTALAQ